jgi:excisionase family DNA binding protein
MSPPNATFLSPRQLAERLGFHVESVRRLLRQGRLPSVRIGRRLRVPADALDRFIADHAVITPATATGGRVR